MKSIFLAQWMKDRRNPTLVVMFCALSVIATLLFSMNSGSKIHVYVFPEDSLTLTETEEWLDILNDNDTFMFQEVEEEQARTDVSEGRRSAAVQLMKEDYRIFSAMEDPNAQLVEQYVQAVYTEELQLRTAELAAPDPEEFRKEVQERMEDPGLTVETQSPDGGALVEHNMGTQLLFGFTMFLVMFTVGFKVNAISLEKATGLWDRVILSPVTKWKMYSGHLAYTFLIGMLQIVIVFLIFLFGFGYDIGDRFGVLMIIAACFTLTMTAFTMLISGLLRTQEQFMMVFPSVIPLMPLISGVYMPPGFIDNDVMLFVAEFIPLTHAMEAMMGTTLYDYGFSELLLPLAKLMLIGAVCMGVGINLMERGKQ
ncbi:ABC transporter permease [Alteribacillus sp. HJP-4]|uniref:ABC transporter permease n=1 Tax=Alteribacillus sp. HJP-4 TaxID=2775394 RepID=UPI0035CD0861